MIQIAGCLRVVSRLTAGGQESTAKLDQPLASEADFRRGLISKPKHRRRWLNTIVFAVAGLLLCASGRPALSFFDVIQNSMQMTLPSAADPGTPGTSALLSLDPSAPPLQFNITFTYNTFLQSVECCPPKFCTIWARKRGSGDLDSLFDVTQVSSSNANMGTFTAAPSTQTPSSFYTFSESGFYIITLTYYCYSTSDLAALYWSEVGLGLEKKATWHVVVTPYKACQVQGPPLNPCCNRPVLDNCCPTTLCSARKYTPINDSRTVQTGNKTEGVLPKRPP